MDDSEENNPYVLVITKKVRALRKKLEKVKALEGQRDLGKDLNDEQVVLLNSKSTLERSLKEHESLKSQLEEVARDEQANGQAVNGVATAEEEEHPLPAVPPEAAEEEEDGRHPTTAPVIHEQTTQTEPEPPAPPQPVHAVAEEKDARAATGESPDRKSVELLLKLLHVVGRYEAHTGCALPSEVDYFGKVILGKTSLPEDNFFDALAQSVNDAILYLERGDHSNNQVANGKTYKQLREHVDGLADALCQPPTPTTTNAPKSPQLKFNFFADPTGGGLDEAAALLPPPGDVDLTSALDSVSDINALVHPSNILPSTAITVEAPVEIAAGLQPPIEVAPSLASSSQHAPISTPPEHSNAELLNGAIIVDPSAIVDPSTILTDPMVPQEMVIGVSAEGISGPLTPVVSTSMVSDATSPGSMAWMPQDMSAAWSQPDPTMTAPHGTEKMAAARRSRRSRGRGQGHRS